MISALCVDELAAIVDLVVWVEPVDGVPTAHAANHLGRTRLHPGGRQEVLAGIDPIASQDPMAFLPYAAPHGELANPCPTSSRDNAYPYAAERLLSFFADPDRSPDLAIVHTPRHFFPTRVARRRARLARCHPVACSVAAVRGRDPPAQDGP